MVFRNKYSKEIINKFPNFYKSSTFSETIKMYDDGSNEINIHTIFSALTYYVVDVLIKNNESITQEEIDIYNYVEEKIKNFNGFPENTDENDFDNAACVCFLENLQNRASSDRIKYSRFIPYLGEKSKEFCRAWDEFTGVKSPGLWDDA